MRLRLIVFMVIIIIIGFLFSTVAWGNINCEQHPTYCAIIKLNPKINKAFAMELSNEIYRKSIEYNVDKYRVIAIMQQESNTQMDAYNTKTTSTVHKECDEWKTCVITEVTVRKITDFGLFQFHINTVKRHNLDVQRIMTDMPFVVDFAVKMIAKKINMCKDKWPKTPWACYNSATKGPHEKYVKLVNRYYLGKKH